MAIEPIKGFYVHDEATDTDGVAKVDYGAVANTPDFDAIQNGSVADLLYNAEWEQGGIYPDSGNQYATTNVIRTGYVDIDDVRALEVVVNNGYYFYLLWYSDIGVLANTAYGSYFSQFINPTHGISQNIIVPANAKYFRMTLMKSDNTAIMPSENDNITVKSDYKLLNDVDFTMMASEAFTAFTKQEPAELDYNLTWVNAIPAPANNTINSQNHRICTNFIDIPEYAKEITITAPEGYKCAYYLYDDSGNKLVTMYWAQSYTFTVEDSQAMMVFGLAHSDDTALTPAEGSITITCSFADWEEEIPDYFDSEIDSAIETARDNIFSCGINGDSFVFISDIHWQSNEKNSPALIKKAVDNLNLDKIICGGDLIGGGEKTANMALLSDCVNAYKDITRFYCLFGNHDSNTIGAPSTADNFTKSEVYALEQKQSDFVMNYGEPCYFYFDNPTTKTRYICLDTGLEGSALPSAQSDWLTATLNSTPDNYHILVFAHIIYLPTNSYHVGITKDEVYRSAFMVTVCNMLDTFNTNNQNKKVEAIFGGHMHFDADFTTTGGIPIVLIDCDARLTFTETTPGSGTANHAAGTINEQCFDIVSIDYANSTIKCTRVGRGSDRTITY